ncbi:transcription factor GTE10 isoform X2 [Silene latifolia]|uniref:transcription factor GTE10 isoform X2 n=1 Tax=Silene latifolia TaxID=37657 RepID=UPI003D78A369
MVMPPMIGQKVPKTLTQKSSVGGGGGGGMMGKSRKFGMGNPGKMMPDFRHAVETMAESEGFGSSGRVETEITLSEDSCSPKRKCISLTGDSRDRFWVPVQVLSLSKMTREERKESEVRLKREVEEVRILHRRISSLCMSSVVSPASDIRSCSDGQKRPPLESTVSGPERVPQGKKRLSPGRNGPRLNKGFCGPVEPPRQAVRKNSVDPFLMKMCSELLNRLLTHKFGWVFKDPVDTVKLNIPDYFNVIKHPMDFTTIKNKLASGEYISPVGFAADVRLTFSNAMTYNPPKNDVHIMAQVLSKYFEQRWKSIEKKIPTNKDVPQLPSRTDVPRLPSRTDVPRLPSKADVPRLPSKTDVPLQNKSAIDQIPHSKKSVTPVGHVGKLEPVKKVMTNEEKHKLRMELEALITDLPESIIDFLKENSSGDGETGEDEIEIDIDALSDDVLFKLRKLLDDLLVEKNKQHIRAEPCEMELHHESGFSNSSLPPGKGYDAADEDIDIGGNDHPVSSFPPVEIVKDTVNKNNRGSNASSSSSGSGSSSSG